MVLPFNDRYKRYDPVVSTTEFIVDFPVFDDDDLSVFVASEETVAYTVDSTYVFGVSNSTTITLNSAVSGVSVEIYGSRQPARGSNFLGNSPLFSGNIQRDMDALTAVQQEMYRDHAAILLEQEDLQSQINGLNGDLFYTARQDIVDDLGTVLKNLPEGREVRIPGTAWVKMLPSDPRYGTNPIPDMPGYGWPLTEPVTPQHFGDIDGVSDSAIIQAMWNATTNGQVIRFIGDIDYGIDATISAGISYRTVYADGARFKVYVNGAAFNLNPDADANNVEATAKAYGNWFGGNFIPQSDSTTSPNMHALRAIGIRQMTIKGAIFGTTVREMAAGIVIAALGGHDIENNRFIYTLKGIHGLNLGVASVSTALTTTVLKNNQFLLDAASAQQALYINCGWNRWNIIGGFVNGTTAASFHFTNYNEGKTLNIEGVGFEQAVAGGKFLYLEDTSGNEMQNLNIDGAQFTGNPVGAEHVHIELERVRRTVLRGVNTQSDQTASNWTLKMDANCKTIEADAGCRFMDFPLNLAASLSIDASVNREQIVFPDRKIETPFALSGYNGDSFSSGTATLDMSTLITGDRYPTHGIPPKGYTLLVTARDSASSSSAYRRVEFGSTTAEPVARRPRVMLDGITDDQYVSNTIFVNAHTDGSIALEVFASGTDTLDLWVYLLEIHN